MKHFILTILFVSFMATPALADPCKGIELITTRIMEARQAGLPIGQVFEILDRTIEDSEAREGYAEIIIAAYEEPKYRTETMQQDAVNEFSNKWTTACYKLTRGI